jgi:rifampicin phosphotransferase
MAGLVLGGPALMAPTIVGYKFARQESLRRRGYPVPEFFCVPADAFDRVVGDVLTALPAIGTGNDHDAVASWSAAARDAVLAVGVDAELGGELLSRFDTLVGSGGVVAVRACVVADRGGTGEDGADDPFAGMSDSFLYVSRDNLLHRVARCWASAFNPEAVLYRLRRGVDPTSVRVAVGVQRMVGGQRSFVAFTRDPRDGAERCVIAAGYGTGEGVVQEKADIDHFFVDRGGAVRSRSVRKARMVGIDPDDPSRGPTVIPVPADWSERPVLSDDEARRIAALATDVQRHFGAPQDVEGTITADGTIHLVQARPVTTAPAIPWTNHNVTESFPGVSSALTFSQALEFYRSTFGDFYRRMGVPSARLRRNEHHLAHMIGSLDGRVYYRLDAWYALHDQIPGFELMRPVWERSLGLADEDRRPPARARWSRLRTVLGLPGLAVRLARHPGSVRAFVRWWDAFVTGYDGLEQRRADELTVGYRTLWTQVALRWGVTVVNSFYALAAVTVVNTLVRRWLGTDGDRLLIGLLCGGTENRSVAALRSAIALAERFRADPELCAAIRDAADDRPLYRDLVEGRYGNGIAGALRAHLHRYGDRAPHDLKLEVPTPRQQPWTLLATLRPLIESGLTVDGSRADEQRVRRMAELELRFACPGVLRRMVLRTAIAALRSLIRVREDTRYCRSQLYGVSRRILWRLGELLVESGRLDESTDVVDLTVAEVLGAFDGTLPGSDLRGLVRHRRAERHRSAATVALPPYLSTPADAPVAASVRPGSAGTWSPAAADELLCGLASSKGTVRGRAKIVLDPTVPPESCRGRVLVARETDPGWLFLMLGASAMVVERGTLLSHTAITGRLLGIPTVVAVEGATTRIDDDTWLEVDGAAGTVRILSDAGVRP